MEQRQKTVRYIPPTINVGQQLSDQYRQKRVVAYCRVSTKEEEQLNSYETQVRYYTERIRAEPDWQFVGIFADKGITGTSVKKREEFRKMIRLCQQGKVDMIIVKSISRFARNTVDCLQHTRLLTALGVDVYFEEQSLHSTDPGAEFYITIYGSIAQSESENISANVKWGKAQSAREGKVAFSYANFLGYRRGENGEPEIVPEEAEIVKFIFNRYLEGDSLLAIKQQLESKNILTAKGKTKWGTATIHRMLTNEKYMGDAIINKTYVMDCLSKKIKVNNGERGMYYVENNHEGIIDKQTFTRVQEEIARRNSKVSAHKKGAKTEKGKYSSKYALTQIVVCGKCKTAYRRCTWIRHGVKKVFWRCVQRIEFGKRYCSDSPSIEESLLHKAIMTAIMKVAKQDASVLRTLKTHIASTLSVTDAEDDILTKQLRISEIEAKFKSMLDSISSDNAEQFDEVKAKQLMDEKAILQEQLAIAIENKQKIEKNKSRLDDIFNIIDGLRNHPMEYDDKIVRQLIECIVVESKTQIKIIFKGGMVFDERLVE